MLALPPAPELKLLTEGRYFVGVDLASGPDVCIIERWINWRGRGWERILYTSDGRLLDISPSPYWHGGPPWVEMWAEIKAEMFGSTGRE